MQIVAVYLRLTLSTMLVQNSVIYLILNFLGTTFSTNQGKHNSLNVYNSHPHFCIYIAQAISCQVYPSEYAYHGDSVNRAESPSAKCRRYPDGHRLASEEQFIHCDGTQLKLADSNFGQEQYRSGEYYQWPPGGVKELLFILPTRVSLTTITLHYYTDNIRGLSRLRFYAVPDNFDVWDASTKGYPHVDVASVPPGGEPAGRRNVSIDVNFTTEKVLMNMYTSSYQFALSELEFFKCKQLIRCGTEFKINA